MIKTDQEVSSKERIPWEVKELKCHHVEMDAMADVNLSEREKPSYDKFVAWREKAQAHNREVEKVKNRFRQGEIVSQKEIETLQSELREIEEENVWIGQGVSS